MYRTFPNKINYHLVHFVELIAPKGIIENNKCRHALECEPLLNIIDNWGKAVTSTYRQVDCCKSHTRYRYAMVEVFQALQRHNIISFLESGSVLGIRRHKRMQIPWVFDGDIGFVIDNQILKMNTFEMYIHHLIHTELPGYSVKTLHKLDANGKGHCGQIQVIDTYGNMFDLFAYRHNHYSKEDEKKYGTDFGYLGTCFSNARQAAKYIMPLKPCKFYDITLKCPNDIDKYLISLYGENILKAADGVDQ